MSASTVDEDAVVAPEGLLAHFATLMEPFPDAIVLMTIEGIIVSWNRGAESIFGYRREEVSGCHVALLAPPERHHEVPLLLQELGAGTPLPPAPTEVLTKEGRRITICYSASPITDGGGNVLWVAAIARDITEKREKERALRRSEERFRTIFALAGLGIAEVGLGGEWLDANQKLCTILGYSCEELAGRRLQELVHPEDREVHRPFIGSLLEGAIDSYAVEKRCYHRDGRLVWVHLTVSLVRDQAGAPSHYIAVVEEITEAKKLQAELHQSKAELELRVAERTVELTRTIETLQREMAERERLAQSLDAQLSELISTQNELKEKEELLLQQSRLAAMGEMIGNIAHQWRQPLNTLALVVQDMGMTCSSGQSDPEALDGSVKKCLSVIDHMAQTIEDFRSFFRPDKERVSFRLSFVVDKTLALMKDAFTTQRIKVEVQAAEDPVIVGHPNECCQVLLNILINARDAFEERKIREPVVVIAIGREKGRATLTVTDNAGGIGDDALGRVFERNFTTKGPERGTGLGLFMSQMMVERKMKGTITAGNTGGGARFRIEFPAEE